MALLGELIAVGPGRVGWVGGEGAAAPGPWPGHHPLINRVMQRLNRVLNDMINRVMPLSYQKIQIIPARPQPKLGDVCFCCISWPNYWVLIVLY